MFSFFQKTHPYFQTLFRYPLYILAAFIAAVIGDLLLSLQPRYLRGFLDYALQGDYQSQLWGFVYFMIASIALSYIFDFIAIAIRFDLARKIELYFRQTHSIYCKNQQSEKSHFAIRQGLIQLSEFTLHLTLDLALILSRIFLILIFLVLEDKVVGFTAFITLVITITYSTKLTLKLGRIGKTKEIYKAKLYRLFSKRTLNTELDKLLFLDRKRFRADSLLFFLSYFTFQVIPVVTLIFYLKNQSMSLGSIASIFLYFSLLYSPYQRLILILKNSFIYYSQSQIFREEFEKALEVDRLKEKVPAGIIWVRSSIPLGQSLNNIDIIENEDNVYFWKNKSSDSENDIPSETKQALERLQKKSRKKTQLILSDAECVAPYCHFYQNIQNKLNTTTNFLFKDS